MDRDFEEMISVKNAVANTTIQVLWDPNTKMSTSQTYLHDIVSKKVDGKVITEVRKARDWG